jgi:hypothetical protein
VKEACRYLLQTNLKEVKADIGIIAIDAQRILLLNLILKECTGVIVLLMICTLLLISNQK